MRSNKSNFFKSEYFSAVVVISLGIFFLSQAYTIETVQRALIGPRLVPMQVAGLIVALGVLQFIVACFGRNENVNTSASEIFCNEARVYAVLCRPPILRTVALIAIGFAYIWLFSATGYLVATGITMALLLFVFGTRGVGKITIITIGGTAAYYIIFIWLMGIYDPPGWLINLEMLGFS